MRKIKNITKLEDLKFKLGESYTSKHITIYRDYMYISKEFAKYLYKGEFKELRRYSSNLYLTEYDIGYKGTKITIGIRESLQSDGVQYSIAGSSGSHGFNGYQYSRAEYLGVRAKRATYKEVVEIFKKSHFIRLEKVKKLLSNDL